MERAPTRSVVCGFDQRVTCTVSCDTEGPKSSCSTHCPKHQEMKSWMDLQHVRFFYIYTYLFDCSASQLQHVGSSIFFKNLQHAGFLVAACEIQFPDQGSNPDPLQQEPRVLATGPPGKSCKIFLKENDHNYQIQRHQSQTRTQNTILSKADGYVGWTKCFMGTSGDVQLRWLEGGPGRTGTSFLDHFSCLPKPSGSCELLLLMPSFLAPSIVVAIQQQQRQF